MNHTMSLTKQGTTVFKKYPCKSIYPDMAYPGFKFKRTLAIPLEEDF